MHCTPGGGLAMSDTTHGHVYCTPMGGMSGNARASIAMVMKPVVEFEKIEIVCPDREAGNIIIDLTRQGNS